MSKERQYEWLIVAEGSSDIAIFREYLKSESIYTISVGSKGDVLNANAWNPNDIGRLDNDVGRKGFKGVIIVIDTDDNSCSPFDKYRRCDSLNYKYKEDKPKPAKNPTGDFWFLDSFFGTTECPVITVRGVTVPNDGSGCLETELLAAYGFPTKPQPHYCSFVDIIKKATEIWKIPNKKNGDVWWKSNETAKMDKFIFYALNYGFKACGQKPAHPTEKELSIISNIRKAMADS
ncbi:MAG: hypothetical protein FWG42_09120 [Clostridiales bacterium]|nr:hypothetical protein [Clostridiales bacterium]